MYKIRVILDTKEDIIRTILVDDYLNLETLHFTIAKAFDFDGSEMASFYRTDDEWNEGEEIPLFNMSEAGDGIFMKNCFIRNTIPTEAPEKEFIAEQSNHDFEDNYGSDFNNDFESLDDIDFDQY